MPAIEVPWTHALVKSCRWMQTMHMTCPAYSLAERHLDSKETQVAQT